MRKVLVTGAAGFIGFHLAQRLLNDGDFVIGLDIVNDYYDVDLKNARLHQLREHPNFRFIKEDLADRAAVAGTFDIWKPELVVNLAAQAGVRYSLENPYAYMESNLVGFLNIVEACRQNQDYVKHLVYASSSSVYGANIKMPFSTEDSVDHPISLYAASKRANELIAHSYSHLFDLPTTGLRFFSVYGPWGRPDMALYIFTKSIIEGTPIPVFNYGNMRRNFTYVDDVVEGITRVMARTPKPDASITEGLRHPGNSHAPYRVYNVGNDEPVDLLGFIHLIEEKLGKKAILDLQPMQKGDVPQTFADVDDLKRDTGYRPSTSIEEGVSRFVAWYSEYQSSRNASLRLAA